MVDYDFGTITLLSDRARMKTSELEVRYEYKPLFSLDNRTFNRCSGGLDVNDNLNLEAHSFINPKSYGRKTEKSAARIEAC